MLDNTALRRVNNGLWAFSLRDVLDLEVFLVGEVHEIDLVKEGQKPFEFVPTAMLRHYTLADDDLEIIRARRRGFVAQMG